MGRILLYIVGGYVLAVLLSSVLFAGPGSLPLLVLAVIGFFLYRARPQAGRRLLAGARALEAPPDDASRADADRYERRFAPAEARLAAAFPEDPLESPALVAVLAAYLHEPPEARARLEDEYRGQRERFVAWQSAVRRLGSPGGLDGRALRAWVDEAKELDEELSALEGEAGELASRGVESEGLQEQALEQAARAGEAVDAARLAAASVADSERTRTLSERLEAADAKQQEAWRALAEGQERPVTALRLAREATALADEVKRRATRVAALPAELERRLSELDASIGQEQADLERVHEEFDAASASYAPSCWHEIGGVGHAARRAIDRAGRLRESAAAAAASTDPDRLEQADREAEQAGLAVEEARRLREAIERHLSKLEAAAVEGRDRVVQAEQELDRAWAAVHEAGAEVADDELLRRAADLIQEARAGLGRPQPDWLAIVELAGRGAGLAREAGSGRSRAATRVESSRLELEEAKARAKDARDSAWSQAIVRPAAADTARPLLEAAEDAYQAGLRVESDDEAGSAEALAAFAEAERLAAAFCREMEDVETTRAGSRVVADGETAHTLVWDFKLTRTVRL